MVGWRFINKRGLEKLKRQAKREDGQLLILSPKKGLAADLSALEFSLPLFNNIVPHPAPTVNGRNCGAPPFFITKNNGKNYKLAFRISIPLRVNRFNKVAFGSKFFTENGYTLVKSARCTVIVHPPDLV